MTFKEYIAKRQARNNPQGDFVKDCQDDTTMPDARNWDELRSHLSHMNACREAIDAGQLVWRSYQQFLKKSP